MRDQNPPEHRSGASPAAVADALTGSLPCIRCGYDLRGLTVKGVCPECSTAVRATVLARIDPEADALKPIRHRHVLGLGLRVMFTAALVAVAATWALRAQEAWPLLANLKATPPSAAGTPWAMLQLVALLFSGVGALTLAIPVPGVAGWKSGLAALGALLGYGVTLAAFRSINEIDTGYNAAYIARDADPDRIHWHLAGFGALAIVVLLTRPVIRALVFRCRAIRVGRVDRQHLLVLVTIMATIMTGSLVRLASGQGGLFTLLDEIGTILIFIASILLTVTLIRATIDSWRVAYAIDHPPVRLKQIFDVSADETTGAPPATSILFAPITPRPPTATSADAGDEGDNV